MPQECRACIHFCICQAALLLQHVLREQGAAGGAQLAACTHACETQECQGTEH